MAQVEVVREFVRRHLWPYPVGYTRTSALEPDRRHYRTPDLVIKDQDGSFTVEVVRIGTKSLRVNPLYQKLATHAETLLQTERKHVQEYLNRAVMFLANLRKRETALQQVGEAIVAHQPGFLRGGVRHLVPLTRLGIATDLGLHESTVSRVVLDKTALLPNGQLWPLSGFFEATRGVQDILRELVVNEARPLSDQQLTEKLAEYGYTIARRTVAKYREQMNILPYQLRY